jgi:hypothetical protein
MRDLESVRRAIRAKLAPGARFPVGIDPTRDVQIYLENGRFLRVERAVGYDDQVTDLGGPEGAPVEMSRELEDAQRSALENWRAVLDWLG